MKDFSGKYVLVTGGSKGIGKFIAKDFFSHGATVLICARRQAEIKAACKEIDPTGKRFFGIAADVSKISDCRKLINFAVKKFGTVDILVNNAGIYGEIGDFSGVDVKKWTEAILINLFGTVYCSRFVLPIMKKRKSGKIINFAGGGIGGKKPLPNFSAYYTSKMAVSGFTEDVAAETQNHNVQINCISPGAVNTGFTDYLISQGPGKAGEAMYKQSVEQKKSVNNNLEYTVNLIRFLCSKEANHITGRLLSAKWDKIDILKKLKNDESRFKLRRIDNELFYEE